MRRAVRSSVVPVWGALGGRHGARMVSVLGARARAWAAPAASLAVSARASAAARETSWLHRFVGARALSTSSASLCTPARPPAVVLARGLSTVPDGSGKDAPESNKRGASGRTAGIVMDCLELSKYRLSSLVLATTMAGYLLAPMPFSAITFFGSSIGTGLCIASAAALNQIMEVERDRLMIRTADRPLPTQRMSKSRAIAFATAAGVSGTAVLLATAPVMAAALAAGNIVLYAFVYTSLKPVTPLNTTVGAVVGAIPPMIGWVAHTGTLDAGAWALGALLYLWQMPHFYSLAYLRREDYVRGGFRMLSRTHPAWLSTHVMGHALAIVPMGAVLAQLAVAPPLFALTSLGPASWFAWRAVRFHRNENSETASAVFFASIYFLPVYFGLLFLHNVADLIM